MKGFAVIGVASKSSVAYRRAIPTIQSLQEEGLTRLVGVYSHSKPAFAGEIAKNLGVRHYSHLDDIFNDPDVGKVYIARQPMDHVSLASLALTHGGKDVLVEKPLMLTADLFQEFSRYIRLTGRQVAVNHTFFGSPLVGFRPLIEEEIGRISRLEVQSFGGGRWLEETQDWHWDPTSGGGVTWDLIPHALSIAHLLLGITPSGTWQVEAEFGELPADVACKAQIDFQGCDVTLMVDWRKNRHQSVDLYGSRGFKRMDLSQDEWQVTYRGQIHSLSAPRADWWVSIFRQFLNGGLSWETAASIELETTRIWETGIRRTPIVTSL